MAEERPKPAARTVFIAGIAAVVLAALLLCLLIFIRHRSVNRELEKRKAAIGKGVPVQVALVSPAPRHKNITLSAEAVPYAAVTLYAKVSGYLKEIRFDKGDPVTAGAVVAVIDSPELVNQYRAARIDASNKRRFAERERMLLKDGIISRQEADDAVAAANAAEANAAALKNQMGYQVIRAPFDGVVTARFADPGELLQSAATGRTSALPVVTVSKTDRLRVYVYLDQKSAARVRRGDEAEVSDAARPDLKLPARVARISGQLDPRSRTMLVELDLPNPSGRILAGSFVQVTITLTVPRYLQIPAEAMYTEEEKNLVAVIGPDNRVRFTTVTVGDSDGKMLQVSEGLQEGDRVALNPGTWLVEGELVQPVAAPSGSGGSGGRGGHPVR